MTDPHPRHVAAPAEAILDEVERAVVGKREVLELVLLGAAGRRPRPARGRARRGQDADRALVRRRDRACASAACSSRPTCCPPTSPARRSSTSARRASSSGPGPVFSNLLLGDEINRAPPKTQAALLEAMEERQVTADDGTAPARPARSSCWPRRTRSSTRAPTRCPRPSSTASCCACASATRRPTTSGSMLDARARRGTDAVALQRGHRRPRRCCACRPPSRPSTSTPRSVATWSPSPTATRESSEVEVGASPRGSLALLRLARARAALEGATSSCPTTSRPSPCRRWRTGSCCARSCGSARVDAADVVQRGCSTPCRRPPATEPQDDERARVTDAR